ncbi:MAG: hypothetical protein H0X37_25595 [Herpetosiphonaceae bacterium]|nr:hypothetical protein [Herpetosiphonaceae bacterium]
MTIMRAPSSTTTGPSRRYQSLTCDERRSKLQAAQRAYESLRASVWGPGNALLVPLDRYEHYLRYELQAAWSTLAYWRRMVAEEGVG